MLREWLNHPLNFPLPKRATEKHLEHKTKLMQYQKKEEIVCKTVLLTKAHFIFSLDCHTCKFVFIIFVFKKMIFPMKF